MREVIVSEHLWGKIKEVNDYLINELHLSEEATEKRIRRMEQFVMDFAKRVDHPLCRFKKWRTLGYHCAAAVKRSTRGTTMSFEIIDNTFQVIVLAAMALLAFLLAFRRSSRSCLILAFGYASFMMDTLYYLLHLIILGHGPQVFYVAECSWMASYFFFLSLEIL